MSSACTKVRAALVFTGSASLQANFSPVINVRRTFLFLQCVLEDLDVSVPVCISVQTLGSNGLSSEGVYTMYRADQHGRDVS